MTFNLSNALLMKEICSTRKQNFQEMEMFLHNVLCGTHHMLQWQNHWDNIFHDIFFHHLFKKKKKSLNYKLNNFETTVLCWHLPRKMQGTCISVFTHLLGVDVGYCMQYIVLSTFPFFTSISYKIHCQVHICICTLICPYVVAKYHKWLHIQLTCVMRVFLAEAITALAISISSLASSTGLLRSEFSLISCVEENGNTLRKKTTQFLSLLREG